MDLYFSFFLCGVKKQTVPDIKRCKSAFCSRGGAGHGAEIGLLNPSDIIMAQILPLRVQQKKTDIILISVLVNPGTVISRTDTRPL